MNGVGILADCINKLVAALAGIAAGEVPQQVAGPGIKEVAADLDRLANRWINGG